MKLLTLSLATALTSAPAFGMGGNTTVLTCQSARTFQQVNVEVKRLPGLGGKARHVMAVRVDGVLQATDRVAPFRDDQAHGYRAASGDLAVRIPHIQLMDLAYPYARGQVTYPFGRATRTVSVRCNLAPGKKLHP